MILVTPEQQFTQVLRAWSEVFMRRSMQDFKRFTDESGLSPSQIHTLMRLHHQETCGVSEIGEHLGISNPAASQLVERLVQQGLLERCEAPDDRRQKQISLSRAGRALIDDGIEARQQWWVELTTTLTPQEQVEITRALTVLTEAAQRLEAEKTKQGR